MKKILSIIILTSLLSTSLFAETYAVVVNKGNSDPVDVKARFLLNNEDWPKSGPVEVFTLTGATHEAFLKAVLKMDKGSYNEHWNNRKSAGKSKKPREVKNASYMYRFIKNKKGAIGYIPKAKATGLKEILTFEAP